MYQIYLLGTSLQTCFSVFVHIIKSRGSYSEHYSSYNHHYKLSYHYHSPVTLTRIGTASQMSLTFVLPYLSQSTLPALPRYLLTPLMPWQMSLTFVVTTVTEVTYWRLYQLVDVERTVTITHSNVVFPVTATTAPVVTDLTGNYSLSHRRVGTVNPTGCMGSTALLWDTLVRYLVTSRSFQTVPTRIKRVLIAL